MNCDEMFKTKTTLVWAISGHHALFCSGERSSEKRNINFYKQIIDDNVDDGNAVDDAL